MNEAMTKDYVKFDILIDVKTLCRKAKTTTWARLVQDGFKIGDSEWDKDDIVMTTSVVGHARMGLLASYMTDTHHFLNPNLAKAILPELDGVANGLGHIVLVGYEANSSKADPLITILFEFSQKPGEKIKVSKNAQAYYEREEELHKGESLSFVRDLYAGIEVFEQKHKAVPGALFADVPEIPEYLRGRRFSPCLSRHYNEIDGSKHVIINVREHTTEPEGVSPPYLFSVSAGEGDSDVLWLTYEGNADPTMEQKALVKEVLLALQKIVTDKDGPFNLVTN